MAETADEPVEPIKQKICILKASIHCEGCKRKIKKLLNQVQGVESVDVDIKQQKVTVTGNVDADTLVKKLVKSGKKAEVWPQKEEKIHGNGKGKEKESESQSKKIDHRQGNSVSGNAKSPETSTKAEVAVKFVEGSVGPVKGGDGGSAGNSGAGACAGASMKAAGGVQGAKSEGTKSEENSSAVVEPAPSAEKEAVEKSNGGGGTSGKKKKKKGQSGNIAAPSGGVAPPEQRESRNREPGPPPPTNHSPPRGHHYPPPHSYYTPPPQPLYAVSYNTAYPTSSYTASYYAAPPPYAHAYVHPGPVTEPTPSDPYYTPPPPYDPDLNPRQPLDSFEIFSDENPNGCFVM